ncbi:MAG: alanine--glyoxylate aminotransferase family protein [Deltaproteobacteria bacterium]|nr:alanine--glyoxylate aminotransferase family protein [Deltaproteobacteria bacterium]MBW2121229.1 alanine--glyoxylate aminotransferase family protein [Deltaproteobacteria bacterium]
MGEHALFNMSAGPVEATPRTLRALSRQIMYHYDPEFAGIFEDTTEKLKRLMKTENDVIIMQGEALLGLEAAAFCTIDEGDKCLNLVSGVYGHLYAWYIKSFGGELVEVRTDFNRAIDPSDVERAFKQHPDIKFMSVVHCETPSGTLNPIKEICQIAKRHGALTVVDAVSSTGGVELEVDRWGLDICVVGPQKCLASSPGLALVSVSEAAWEKMRKKKNPVRYTYMSMLDMKEQWLVEKEKRRFPLTIFTSEVVALNEALAQLFEEGLDRVIERHKRAARMCRAGVKGMGLELWADSEEICATCVTAIKTPDGVDDAKLRRHMYDNYRVLISGGFGDLIGKLFRIGHMGKTAQPVYVAGALAMLERSLMDLGYPVKPGAGVGAALEAM